MTEPWLEGPLPGIIPELQPAAHALELVRREIPAALAGFDESLLWVRPGSAAPLGFHLLHLAGATERLLAYAAGAQLTEQQRQALALEQEPESCGKSLAELSAGALAAIERVMGVLRATQASELGAPRAVGRKALPSNVRGLLFHIAEHAQRHNGQIATTVKALRGRASGSPG